MKKATTRMQRRYRLRRLTALLALIAGIWGWKEVGSLQNTTGHRKRSQQHLAWHRSLHKKPVGARSLPNIAKQQKMEFTPRDVDQLPSRGGYARLPAYVRYVTWNNPHLPPEQASRIAGAVLASSDRYRVDPRLVVAMVGVESEFKPRLRSSKGALGLGQLMPETVRDLQVADPFDPDQNLDGAVRYLKRHLVTFRGRHPLALAAYNAGGGAVRKWHGIPPYRETHAYVRHVLHLYRQLTH